MRDSHRWEYAVLDHSGLDYYDPERGTPLPASAPRPARGAKSGKALVRG